MRAAANAHPDKTIALYFQDARVGQKGRTGHRWWIKGQRPPGLCDKRFASAYLFAAVRPATGDHCTLVLPEVSTEAMSVFLEHFAAKLAPDVHAVMVLDQAGWQRERVQLDEGTLFVFAVDDIQRIEERVNAGIGAPERDCQADNKAYTKDGFSLCRQVRQLLAHDIDRAARHKARDDIELAADSGRIREQAIDGNKSRNGGKNCEQGIKGDACCNGHYAMLRNIFIDPEQNILPSPGGNF